jgi:pimeloyl-ACP methyl ester carboxylesterase
MSDGFADLEDGRLWYERAGGGFLVVFVHSGLMDARVWEPQFEAFAEQHEVVRYDRRGFGRSDAPSGPFSDETDQLVNVGKPERFNRLALDFLAFAD